MPNVKCYSIYPSKQQKNKDLSEKYKDNVKIYELDNDIPICESISPVSSRRWHGMSKEEIDKYVNTLEDLAYNYIIEIEKKHSPNKITFCISHHTFMNSVILNNIMNKRKKNNLNIIPCVVYVHGTGLKMYQNELNKLKEYPSKFYPMINKLEIFSDKPSIYKSAIAISEKSRDEFIKLFPKYPKNNIILSLNGINTKIFNYKTNLDLNKTLNELNLNYVNYLVKDKKPLINKLPLNNKYKYMILFVGKLADWKRVDTVLYASNIYNKELNKDNILTLIVGGGSQNDFIKYQELSKKLNNKNVYFLGPQMQDILAKLYNIANVGTFPSKNEPFGMVLIECMACGTPIIGANSGGPKDFINKKVGVLIDENDDNKKFGNELGKMVVKFLKENAKEKRQKDCLELAKGFTVTSQCQKLFEKIIKVV